MISEDFKAFSIQMAELCISWQDRLSHAEITGACRIVAAKYEAESTGGYVKHLMVVDITEDINQEEDEWWKNAMEDKDDE